MSYRLINEKDSTIMLGLSAWAWHSILDLAEDFGWNPLGTVLPEWSYRMELAGPRNGKHARNGWNGDYTTEDGRMVVLDDALNLADALERAFLHHEPQHIADYNDIFLGGLARPTEYQLRPGIGAITALVDFCRLGPFWIERF